MSFDIKFASALPIGIVTSLFESLKTLYPGLSFSKDIATITVTNAGNPVGKLVFTQTAGSSVGGRFGAMFGASVEGSVSAMSIPQVVIAFLNTTADAQAAYEKFRTAFYELTGTPIPVFARGGYRHKRSGSRGSRKSGRKSRKAKRRSSKKRSSRRSNRS